MPPFDDAARLARMTAWVKEIEGEVADILQQHFIFWEVQEVIRRNPQLSKVRSHFFQWMGEVFAASAAVAVRRQVDSHDDSVCLRRLLREIKEYAPIVTREFYLGLITQSGSVGEWLIETNNDTFDKWAGVGGAHVDATLVEADFNLLLDKCRKIQHYATKRVAHFDKSGVTPGMLPTFKDLDDAYKVITDLTQKYYLMFTGIWVGQVRPTITYPWMDVFSIPWLP